MANETGDLLMMVLVNPGSPVAGESSSQTDFSNQLLAGFRPNRMFEITNFSFGVETLKDKKTEAEKNESEVAAHLDAIDAAARAHKPPLNLPRPPPIVKKLMKALPALTGSPIGEPKACPVKEISFTRPIDVGSNLLMQYCIDCKTLHGAVVVKLKPAGGPSAGQAYLRMEFINVLFTDMTWSNGEPVEERCTFITRAVNVLYRPQLPDGSLGGVKSGFWSRLPSVGERLIY